MTSGNSYLLTEQNLQRTASNFYIVDQVELRATLRSLTQLSVSADGWTHHYRDDKTGDEWMLTSHQRSAQGLPLLVLKKLPELSVDEVIDLALSATNSNDIIGAAFDLMIRERVHGVDFRQKLVDALTVFAEPPLSNFNKERVTLLINQCELMDTRNRREILDKPYTIIEQDALYFQQIAKDARILLAQVQ